LFDQNAFQLIFHNAYIRTVFETDGSTNEWKIKTIAPLEKTTNYVLLQ